MAFAPQIFNLMKFDSYTRFLKSQLYQECVLAEVEGRTLPDSQQVPSSPASKHSINSDHSNVSTPKKVLGQPLWGEGEAVSAHLFTSWEWDVKDTDTLELFPGPLAPMPQW